MSRVLALLAVSILLAGCSMGGVGDDSPEGQLRSNQAVLLILQNQEALDHLYFSYNGEESPSAYQQNAQLGSGTEQIGELNLMMHNVGASVTAGGLYVSGYDPNLITVKARAGQVPINEKSSTCRDGFTEISVIHTGRYSVTKYCQLDDEKAVGGTISDEDGDGWPDVTISGFNLPFGDWLVELTGIEEDRNTLWSTAIGIFNDITVGSCGVQDGKFGCQLIFGDPNFDVNRASYGYRLVNLLQADIRKCEDNCRPFPPYVETGRVLHGVADDYPLGDTLFYDYDVFLNRAAWNPLLNDMQQTFQVTACYGYTTTVTPTVCVDPDPSNNRNDACKTAPIIFEEPQGAPIKVTRIDQRAQPGKMAFTIYVEHVGGGQVWTPGSLQECGPYYNGRPNPRHLDTVQLLDARILGQPDQLRCMPRTTTANGQQVTYVTLQNGKGLLTCEYPLRDNVRAVTAYSSAITLEFGYIYQNTVQKDVIIHRT